MAWRDSLAGQCSPMPDGLPPNQDGLHAPAPGAHMERTCEQCTAGRADPAGKGELWSVLSKQYLCRPCYDSTHHLSSECAADDPGGGQKSICGHKKGGQYSMSH